MSRKKNKRRHWGWIIVLALLALLYGLPWFVLVRGATVPSGMNHKGPPRPIPPDQIRLLIDSTTWDTNLNERVIRQEIFDAALQMIREAKSIIYADFFLWNGWQGSGLETHRKLSSELASALIKKKKDNPDIQILVFTDPINRVYGTSEESFYGDMESAGIVVVFTDLTRMKESNFIYALPARFYGGLLMSIPPFRKMMEHPRVTHPFMQGAPKISRAQFARLLFFKANHRKMLITDSPYGELRLLVTSANPADGSSAHSNMGIMMEGSVAEEALSVELECVEWSAGKRGHVLGTEEAVSDYLKQVRETWCAKTGDVVENEKYPKAEWLTDQAIREKVLSMLNNAGPGDEVRIALFYLSDREIVRAIHDAAYGGANVRLILDANKDAFGREKIGIPNRPVAAELLDTAKNESSRLKIRWALTHGEQFHTKVLTISNPETGKNEMLCGSANWTGRNLKNRNLEANIYLSDAPAVVARFTEFFDTSWNNSNGLLSTVDYAQNAETGFTLWWKTALYRFQEKTGACTF